MTPDAAEATEGGPDTPEAVRVAGRGAQNSRMPGFVFWVVLSCLVVPLGLAGATAPGAWDTDTAGIYLPACQSGAPKHFEVPLDYDQKALSIHVFDLLKSGGWTNLRYTNAYGQWTWSADCTLGA